MLEGSVVLVVDDHQDSRLLVSYWLERRDARVVQASNGVEALAWLAAGPADAILTDFQMPVMDGLELLSIVKSQRPNIPVFLMTAAADLSKRQAEALGASDLFYKPLAVSPIMDALDRQVRPLRSESSTARNL